MASVARFWGSANTNSKLYIYENTTPLMSTRQCSRVLGLGGVSPGVDTPRSGEPNREIFEACRNGDVERVRRLVRPENVNSRDTAGRKSTPLHFAAGKNSWYHVARRRKHLATMFHTANATNIADNVTRHAVQLIVYCNRIIQTQRRLYNVRPQYIP